MQNVSWKMDDGDEGGGGLGDGGLGLGIGRYCSRSGLDNWGAGAGGGETIGGGGGVKAVG